VLLRSGIGPADELKALGIACVEARAGVGRNLQDHPALRVAYSGTPELVAELRAYMRRTTLREEGPIAKGRSSYCREAFDLHVYPFGTPYEPFGQAAGTPGGERWTFALPVANMTPRSRGSVRLASRDPAAAPLIDHAYLTDPGDRDRAVLLDGLELARSLASQSPLRELLGVECQPGPSLTDKAQLRRHVRNSGVHYYHPVGSCGMGPAGDPNAVVDAAGRVHGVPNLRVADCSVMPVIPRANTNIPAVVVGEKIAAGMLEA
jgi:choline dehydrogenase